MYAIHAFHHIIKDEIFRNKKKHLFINYGSIVDQTGISKLKLILKNILDNKYCNIKNSVPTLSASLI